jgi:curved DNA-binding protein CbpA
VTSLYKTLGVHKDTPQEEIRRAFRRKAKALHPDRSTGDAEKMALVNKAYEVLSNPQKRLQYDQTGETKFQPPADVARELVTQALMEALGIPDPENPWEPAHNFHMIVKSKLTAKRDEFFIKHVELTNALTRGQKRLKKLKRKSPAPDMVKMSIEFILADLAQQAGKLQVQITNHDLALDLWSDYELPST